NVSAAVVGPGGVVSTRGDDHRVYRLASVTKPIVAVAALIAVEEEAISLDEPAGPEGSTVRHLLAHASGLDFADRDKVRAAPGERRIYSSAGFEVLSSPSGTQTASCRHAGNGIPVPAHPGAAVRLAGGVGLS